MADIDTIAAQLEAALADIVNRLNVAAAPAEIAALTNARDELQQQLDLIDQQGLLAAAGAVATATAVLQATIDTAHTDPIQQFVDLMNAHLDALGASHAPAHAALAPARAPEPAAAPAAPPPAPKAGAVSVSSGTTFAALAGEYTAMFAACAIRPERASLVQQALGLLRKGQPRYAAVAATFNHMPWYFVGILHGMEGSFNFTTHLHNGDPLSARTVNVPPGRPPTGSPPFAWEASAQDALALEHFDREGDFTLPRILFLFERFNGMGYRKFAVPTPYLWSFSNQYTAGKFVQDGVFDPTKVSKQCGAAVMLQALRDAGEAVA